VEAIRNRLGKLQTLNESAPEESKCNTSHAIKLAAVYMALFFLFYLIPLVSIDKLYKIIYHS
jgi:hypothetical protein